MDAFTVRFDHGIKLIGIDAYAVDVSYESMVQARLAGGSAGWVRPVAMVPESHFSADPGAEAGDAR
ncbi:MAG: hypothetical protein ACRDTA_17265 [Pseudonocardiaceae bacterium]